MPLSGSAPRRDWRKTFGERRVRASVCASNAGGRVAGVARASPPRRAPQVRRTWGITRPTLCRRCGYHTPPVVSRIRTLTIFHDLKIWRCEVNFCVDVPGVTPPPWFMRTNDTLMRMHWCNATRACCAIHIAPSRAVACTWTTDGFLLSRGDSEVVRARRVEKR